MGAQPLRTISKLWSQGSPSTLSCVWLSCRVMGVKEVVPCRRFLVQSLPFTAPFHQLPGAWVCWSSLQGQVRTPHLVRASLLPPFPVQPVLLSTSYLPHDSQWNPHPQPIYKLSPFTDLVGKVQEILNWLYTLCSQTKPLQRRKLFCTLDSKIFAKSQKQNTEAISSLHLLTIWIFLDAADVPGHRRKISDTAWELTPGQAVF